VFLGVFDALTDRLGHLGGFADAHAHMPGAIPYYDERAKTESPPALDNFRDARHLNNSFFQVEPRCVNLWHIFSRIPGSRP
jgi:hypothetical protein